MVNTERRLRIVHVSNELCFDGTGHTNSTLDLAVAHAQSGHLVRLVCRRADGPMRVFAKRHGVQLVEGVGASGPLELIRSTGTMRKALRRSDVVHLHTVRSVALTAVASPRRLARRSLATLHNPHQRSTVLMYAARVVVTMSRSHEEVVLHQTRGIKRPVVIQNGTYLSPRRVHVDEVAARVLRGRPIVFVGALHKRKGLDVLLRAMVIVVRRHSAARLHVLGNRDAPEFEELAEILGLEDNVVFEGYVADPREFMKAADVFVLPSRQEGFGNVLTEARESGVPIVASEVGGIPEALDRGTAGDLVPAGSVEGLAHAVLRVLDEPDHAAHLRRAAGDGLDRMSMYRAAEEYEVAYRALLGTEPR